jgi:hypothetical protein
MKHASTVIIGLVILFAVTATLMCSAPAEAVSLEQAISEAPTGKEPGMINKEAPKGYLDIPGAPEPFVLWGLLWAVWVGWIFSSVGAFGGIMAGVGHITIFGLGDYAKTFKKTSPALNKLLTDSIRVSNQFLVGLSALISVTNYYRMGRLVLPLGICLAIGSVTGSILVPIITAGKIDLSTYIGYFGLCVFVIGGFLFYETTERGQRGKKEAKAAAAAFEKANIEGAKTGQQANEGVQVKQWGVSRIVFTFYGVEFSFMPIIPIIGGFLIAGLASFLGIGGGFLFVPFLTSIAGLPMFLVAGTSALAVLIGMIVSIFSYMFIKGVVVFWPLVGVELIGIFIGSMIGPRTSKYIPEIWLKRIFVILALYVGLRYVTKGFLGYSVVPPF